MKYIFCFLNQVFSHSPFCFSMTSSSVFMISLHFCHLLLLLQHLLLEASLLDCVKLPTIYFLQSSLVDHACTPISADQRRTQMVSSRGNIYFSVCCNAINPLTASKGNDIKILSYRAPGVYKPNFVPRS